MGFLGGRVKIMSKLKKISTVNVEKNTAGQNKGGMKTAVIVTAAVLAVIIIFAIVESSLAGTIKVINDTGYDIESLNIYFDNSIMTVVGEQQLLEEYVSDDIVSSSVKAGDTLKSSFDTIPLSGTYSGMIVEYKFADGEETEYNTGYFINNFKGRIVVKFYEENDNIYMSVKASTGIFGSTADTECDAVYNITNSIKTKTAE